MNTQLSPSMPMPTQVFGGNNPSSVAPERDNVHSLTVSALQRLAGLVQQSDNLAYFMRGPIPASDAMGSGGKASSEPTMIEKLFGIHQLINVIENNLRDIDNAVR